MCILGGALWRPYAGEGDQGVADLVRILKQWPVRPASSKGAGSGVKETLRWWNR